jgi:hypothetical protein
VQKPRPESIKSRVSGLDQRVACHQALRARRGEVCLAWEGGYADAAFVSWRNIAITLIDLG